MNEELAELRRLLAQTERCVKHKRRRQTIEALRRLATVASTLALTLELRDCR